MKNGNLIRDKSYAFAIRIIRLSKDLSSKQEFLISRQIARSGRSIGANIEEAQGGATKREFFARITTAHREARETLYWLRLLKDCEMIDLQTNQSLQDDCEELIRMLSAAQKTIKEQLANP